MSTIKGKLQRGLPGRLVVCRAPWEQTLAELAAIAGDCYVFRPGRKAAAAKNLVSSWPARHRPHAGLPALAARRLRTTWIVDLLGQRIDPALVADAAGMRSAAALGPWSHRSPRNRPPNCCVDPSGDAPPA